VHTYEGVVAQSLKTQNTNAPTTYADRPRSTTFRLHSCQDEIKGERQLQQGKLVSGMFSASYWKGLKNSQGQRRSSLIFGFDCQERSISSEWYLKRSEPAAEVEGD
jgi:hypothetical protein